MRYVMRIAELSESSNL